MKLTTEKLFWLFLAALIVTLVVLSSKPAPKFRPGTMVVHGKAQDFKTVVETHCKPFADYCTYDLGDASFDTADYTNVHERWLVDLKLD